MIKLGRWTRAEPIPVAINHAAAVAYRGRGAAGKGNYAVVERYTPSRRRWERVSKLGKPRGGIAAATVAGRIVVVGGGLSYSRSVTSLRIRRSEVRILSGALREVPANMHVLGWGPARTDVVL